MTVKSPEEVEVAAWFGAKELEEEKSAARRLNEVALNEVLCAPLGLYLRHFAWTKDLTGVTQGPLPFFWGVGKKV
jgi:peptide/nickel transport system substrate-binding protein